MRQLEPIPARAPLPSPAARGKPCLRGVSHEVAAFAALPAAVVLLAEARGPLARAAALTYGSTLFALFFVSALFHRPVWSPAKRRALARVDNSTIFLFIGGTHTPLCLLLGPGRGRTLLAIIWSCVALGVLLSMVWTDPPKRLMAAIYSVVGWLFVAIVPALRVAAGDRSVTLLVAGALVYTAGAIVYSLRRPDPFPSVFGYHEIFHLLVIAGALCHFALIRAAIHALG